MKTVLQWQEGTDEPQDEPNISNGTDVVPKRTPTRQPGEPHYAYSMGGLFRKLLKWEAC